MIRVLLQQLDKVGLTEIAKEVRGVRNKKPGRIITEKGKRLLEELK
jgi:ribosomal protein S19E (S16A)